MKRYVVTALFSVVVVLSALMLSEGSTVSEAYTAECNTFDAVELTSLCESIGLKYNVSPELIEAVIECPIESRVGLMHIDPEDCRTEMSNLSIDTDELSDPECNIEVGTARLLTLFEQYIDPDIVISEFLGVDTATAYQVIDRAAQLEKQHEKL